MKQMIWIQKVGKEEREEGKEDRAGRCKQVMNPYKQEPQQLIQVIG